MRSGYLARSCSDRSILMAPLMPRTPPTNIPLTLTLEAEELSPVKELLLLDRPIASIGLLLSGKSLKDCVLLAAIFQSYISIKQIQCSMRRTVGQSNQECKETSRIKCVSHSEKLDLRFLHTKKIKIFGSVTHLILGFDILQKEVLKK